jgi:hypothetical protein
VYSRDQWDETGEIAAKIVEEVFERYTTVIVVRADGRDIRTTGEHPFFVVGRGWTPAHDLRVGDELVCAETGRTVTVEAIRDTGERELVYNLRVADWHTYFVGDEGWGWQVWAHNTYYYDIKFDGTDAKIRDVKSMKRYIDQTESELVERAAAKKYPVNQATARVSRLNEMLTDLVGVLTNLTDPQVTKQLTEPQVKELFRKHRGFTGTLNFTTFFVALTAAPTGGTGGRPRVEWDIAEPALASLVTKYNWTMPQRSQGDWKDHQRKVTTLLRNQAQGTGSQVGVQVELEVTYNGTTLTTFADNLVVDPTDQTKGGILVDAKFSGTYNLSTASMATLRSKLTPNQRSVWNWILIAKQSNNCANLVIKPMNQAAADIGLVVGQPLRIEFVENLTPALYVSDGQGGIVRRDYTL